MPSKTIPKQKRYEIACSLFEQGVDDVAIMEKHRFYTVRSLARFRRLWKEGVVSVVPSLGFDERIKAVLELYESNPKITVLQIIDQIGGSKCINRKAIRAVKAGCTEYRPVQQTDWLEINRRVQGGEDITQLALERGCDTSPFKKQYEAWKESEAPETSFGLRLLRVPFHRASEIFETSAGELN